MVSLEAAHAWSMAQYKMGKEHPFLNDRFKASFAKTQFDSKTWLVEEAIKLQFEFINTAIIGGWFCHILPELLYPYTQTVVNYEIDPLSVEYSRRFNNHQYKRFEAIARDVFVDNFRKDHRGNLDLIINTSCEHMFPMKPIVNEHRGPIYILQSTNDDSHNDHINCVQSADELAEQADLNCVVYKGSKELHNGMVRFMVIGW